MNGLRNRSFRHRRRTYHWIGGRLYREEFRGIFRLNELIDVTDTARDSFARLAASMKAFGEAASEIATKMASAMATQIDEEILRTYQSPSHDWDNRIREEYPIKPIDPRAAAQIRTVE